MPSAVPSYFPESHPQSEISSLSKIILVLGKVRGHRAPNLGCRGAESAGWFDVSQKNCTKYDAWVGTLLWWSCQSPVAHSCGLLNHLNSFCWGMFELNAKFDADSLLYSLSHFLLWRPHSTQCLPPPLTSIVKSLFMHTHSSPLSLATRLHWCCANCSIILMKAGLFLDRPDITRNDLAGSHGLWFLTSWEPPNCFPKQLYSWYYYHQCPNVPISPHPPWHLFFHFFKIIASLMDVKWGCVFNVCIIFL